MSKIKISVLAIVLFIVFAMVGVVYAQAEEGVSKLENPLNQDLSEGAILNIGRRAIETGLGVLGSATLLVFVIGGVMWLTSGGNQERVAKGTKTMLYAAIGILVIFSSYAIISTLITVITGS